MLKRLLCSNMLLIALLVITALVRLPVIYCQPGGQDEDVYAIPGYTVAREGVPRAPYFPSRDLESVFYKADECLFAEPPASFYWQGLFFLVFPPIYGTARLASLVAGLFAIVLAHELGRRWTGSPAIALLGVGIYSVSRLFYFPAITARPDMLCTVFGLVALLMVTDWQTRRSRWQLALTGLLLGLGGLTHPFAIAYSIQIGLFVLWQEEGWHRKAVSFLWLVGWSLLPMLLWVPLIVAFPDAARVQIVNNLLKPGGGLLLRLVWPWQALSHHALLMLDHAGPIQWVLLLVGLGGSTVFDLRSGDSRRRNCCYWMWSSTYFLAVCAGVHPTKGYWCWPAVFICLGLARVCHECGQFLKRQMERTREMSAPRTAISRLGLILPTAVVLAAMVQGSGLRASWTYLTRFTDENYNAPRFVQRLLRELPDEKARYTVDIDYALDFYVAGRKTIIAQTIPFYFRAQDFPYDWLVRGRLPHTVDMLGRLNAELVRTISTPNDDFACQGSIYRQRATASE